MSALLVELHADEIAEAAASFDGHVTHGSLEALLKCFDKLMNERLQLFTLGVVADIKTDGRMQFDHPLAKDIREVVQDRIKAAKKEVTR